jgi:sensor histidine kinase YesM
MIALANLIFRHISRGLPVHPSDSAYHGPLQRGGFHVQSDTSLCTVSEFEAISDNLNAMIQKVNTHIENEYKMQINQKVAEFQALQAEINPHFLYNTLNFFISLNRLGESSLMENSIISLSRLFRYTCEHNYNSTLGQEFSFIRNYLYLQQIRFEDRLNYTLFLEPELQDFVIPKLLIQPLIENAIIHGLEPYEGAVEIKLSAFTAASRNSQTFTVIHVYNNGAPYIPGDDSLDKRIGLKNVGDRLSIFNPDSFFEIRGGYGKDTECFIVIPDKKRQNEACNKA